jgi:hypothetical protein
MYASLDDRVETIEAIQIENGTAQDEIPTISIEEWISNSIMYSNSTFKEIIIVGNVSHIGNRFIRMNDYMIYNNAGIDVIQNKQSYVLCRITKIDGVVSLRLIDYWLV